MAEERPLLTIGQVARRTGLTVRAVRWYADRGLVPPACRSVAGYRLYDGAAVARLEFVRTLRDVGLDLGTIARILDGRQTLAAVAAAHAAAIDAQIRLLQLRRATLRAVAQRGAAPEGAHSVDMLARLSADERRAILADFLEQLDSDVDELLRQLRAGERHAVFRLAAVAPERTKPPYTRGDARLILAREHGFSTWTEYEGHVEAALPSEVELFDRLARSLAAAYTAGDRDAIRNINWQFATSFVWEHDADAMRRRLPRWSAAEHPTPELALDDARQMVAHSYGFADWRRFVGSLTHRARRGEPTASTTIPVPPFYRIDAATRTLSVRGPLSSRHWDDLLAVIKEHGIEALTAGGIDDAALDRITRLGHITRLNLDGSTALTDAGMAHLARLPMLEDLHLGGPRGQITDRGLEVLSSLPRLKRIQLCWQPGISDEGVAVLAHCQALQSVDLMGTHTGDGAIAALAGHRDLRGLRTGRQVSDAGIALLRRIPAFATWRGGEGGEADLGLMSFEGGPTHLLLDGPFTDHGLAGAAALQGLDSLSLFWHCTSFTGDGLAPLRHLPHLTFLGCDGKRCDDAAMRQIANLPGLRMLMAQGTVATDAGFAALSRSPSIEYVWGRECPNLGGRGFAALSAMAALRGLAVSCKGVDDDALATLPRFPALRELMPMDVPDAGFRHVGRCLGLERLWCMYCRDTGDAATEHIGSLPKLAYYYAGKTLITDRSLAILARMDTLQTLEFWACAGITDAGVAHLARLPKLRKVVLDGLPGVTAEARASFDPCVQVEYSG